MVTSVYENSFMCVLFFLFLLIKIHLNTGSCRCCAMKIKFYCIRHHYKSCKKHQDKYGVPSIIPNFQIFQNYSRKNRSETSTSGNTETYQENRMSLVSKNKFTRHSFLDHCNNNHLFEIVPVTCSIYVSLPWSDPSQITRNFFKSVNLQLDEETHYQNC
ncbi:unnamed protein product [Nyctereutes procyonoides]|uniref:RING-type E3 ubiquitin transferase n=1 Tax=Nyctereutes procyonoides TaxID=34880 RepID=A0A811ZVY5_NYCPR|nr:unnamed protein product [Nyctereutes procyonoides]